MSSRPKIRRGEVLVRDGIETFRSSLSAEKRQRTAALQNLAEFRQRRHVSKRPGARKPSGAYDLQPAISNLQTHPPGGTPHLYSRREALPPETFEKLSLVR